MRDRYLFISFVALLTAGMFAVMVFPGPANAWKPFGWGHEGMSKELSEASGLWDDNQSLAEEFTDYASWPDGGHPDDVSGPDDGEGTYGIDEERNEGGNGCGILEYFDKADCDHFYNVDTNGGAGAAHLNARQFIGYWGKWWMDYGYTDAGMKSIGRGIHYVQDMSNPFHTDEEINDFGCRKWLKNDHIEYESWAASNWDDHYFDFYTWWGAYGSPSVSVNSNADIESATVDLAEDSRQVVSEVDCGWETDNGIDVAQERFKKGGEYTRAVVNYAAPSYFE